MKTSIPALNWLIHVLSKDIGKNRWVDNPDAKPGEYPYKVETDPIPPGKALIFSDSREYTIVCDSEETRDMLIDLATSHIDIEKKMYYYKKLNEGWKPASDPPVNEASAYYHWSGLVTTPTLMGHAGHGEYNAVTKKWKVEGLEDITVTHWMHNIPKPLEYDK